jgi:succinate dehydrogenase / fumarate reductase flavoprotein subunit
MQNVMQNNCAVFRDPAGGQNLIHKVHGGIGDIATTDRSLVGIPTDDAGIRQSDRAGGGDDGLGGKPSRGAHAREGTRA